MNEIPYQWIGAVAIATLFIVMMLLEHVRPLRRRVEAFFPHLVRNLSTGAVSLAFMTLLQAPLLVPVALWTAVNDFGIVNWLGLRGGWGTVVSLLLLDYTLWWWHRASHLVPFLWRFHLVHHVDRDLDTSTAFRFHFGELILSIFYRAAQIALIGATPFAVWVWQTMVFVSILFHHSNLRLPFHFEQKLVRFVVTPRMHGVHHTARRDLTDSNWSTILTVWDHLHRTYRDIALADHVSPIGVPAYLTRERVTLGKILVLPFRKEKSDWAGER